jgi:hypothetical protein
MMPLLAVAIAAVVAAPVEAAPVQQSLKPGGAAVVGGWSGVYKAIQGVALQSIVEEDGCLKLSGKSILIDDHRAVDTLPIDHVHEIKPGRYAVIGVQWQEGWGEDILSGLSPPEGEYWVVQIAPNLVTNIGVWPVTSPYPHRYLLGAPDPRPALASLAADGFAPLVSATWVKVPVFAADSSCPPSAKRTP